MIPGAPNTGTPYGKLPIPIPIPFPLLRVPENPTDFVLQFALLCSEDLGWFQQCQEISKNPTHPMISSSTQRLLRGAFCSIQVWSETFTSLECCTACPVFARLMCLPPSFQCLTHCIRGPFAGLASKSDPGIQKIKSNFLKSHKFLLESIASSWSKN